MKAIAAGSTVEELAAALEGSEYVEVNAAKTGVRRKVPVPSEDPNGTVHFFLAALLVLK